VLSGEITNTNLIVFGLTRSGLESTIYRTRGKHYTTDAVLLNYARTRTLHIYFNDKHILTFSKLIYSYLCILMIFRFVFIFYLAMIHIFPVNIINNMRGTYLDIIVFLLSCAIEINPQYKIVLML